MVSEQAKELLENACDQCIDCGLCVLVDEPGRVFGGSIGQVAGEVLGSLAVKERGASGEVELAADLLASIWNCSFCGACTARCPVDIKAADVFAAARDVASDGQVASFGIYRPLRTDLKHNSFSLLREANDIVYEDVLTGAASLESNTTLFFAGCSLSSYTPSLAREVYDWLKERDEVGGITAVCCGKTLDFMAAFDAMRAYQLGLAQALVDSGTTRIITACPNCYSMLKQVCGLVDAAGGIEIVALPEVLVEQGITIDPMRLEGLTPVTVHDSCPDRCGNVFGSNTRALFGQVDQVEMEHSGIDTLCCGAGGLVSAFDPHLCDTRTARRVQEALDVGAKSIMCSCISCLNTFTHIEHPIPTHHYLEYVFDAAVDLSSNGHTADRLRSEFTAEEIESYFSDSEPVFSEGKA